MAAPAVPAPVQAQPHPPRGPVAVGRARVPLRGPPAPARRTPLRSRSVFRAAVPSAPLLFCKTLPERVALRVVHGTRGGRRVRILVFGQPPVLFFNGLHKQVYLLLKACPYPVTLGLHTGDRILQPLDLRHHLGHLPAQQRRLGIAHGQFAEYMIYKLVGLPKRPTESQART